MQRYVHVLCLAILALATPCANAAQPNVIIVMTDDQGYGELSCHGNPILDTPHLDAMAAQSVRLTDFHVAPMCTPTRGQLMTGLDAFRNGAMNVSSGRTLLRPELKTMADLFDEAGYQTGIFGKWHLGDNYPFRPQDRGFREALWFPSSHISSVPDYWLNDYFDDTYIHNGQRKPYEGYCTDIFFRETMRWIENRRGDSPFFAYLPLNAPHGPHFVPDSYRDRIRESIAQNPQVVDHLPQHQREPLISFLAMCANIDDNFGRLDDFLRQHDLFDNTLVIFLTDNGSTMGQRYFNAGMRGRKVTLWEGGHRVPCFIRWPGGDLGQPREERVLTQVQDLLPTLADMCELQGLPGNLDGTTLAPLLRGADQQRNQLDDRMLVVNYSRMPFSNNRYEPDSAAVPRREGAAVMWRRWRLLEDKELYDLETDPHQDRNVIDKHPEVAAKMQAHLDQWWSEVQPLAEQPQRVVIGNPAENPMTLTACEWFDVFVDQQRQIRIGAPKNGTWHLAVDTPGTYELELRRWPLESQLALRDAPPQQRVTDGTLPAGKPLPIAAGRLSIGDFESTQPAANGAHSITFRTDLSPGPVEMQTAFLDDEGNEICGAYYVYVRKL